MEKLRPEPRKKLSEGDAGMNRRDSTEFDEESNMRVRRVLGNHWYPDLGHWVSGDVIKQDRGYRRLSSF